MERPHRTEAMLSAGWERLSLTHRWTGGDGSSQAPPLSGGMMLWALQGAKALSEQASPLLPTLVFSPTFLAQFPHLPRCPNQVSVFLSEVWEHKEGPGLRITLLPQICWNERKAGSGLVSGLSNGHTNLQVPWSSILAAEKPSWPWCLPALPECSAAKVNAYVTVPQPIRHIC